MVADVFGIVGSTLAGTFRVDEVIAEGGYGVVYRAEHVAFRAPVALKFLKLGSADGTERGSFVERFREEAEILFHLSTQIPEVVRPLHVDAISLDDGGFVPFLAMEWVDGTPLDSIVLVREQRGEPPLSIGKTTKMLAPIAHALSRAHHFRTPAGAVVSVTHGDLKPENILITAPGSAARAKILDFGIARAREAARQMAGKVTQSEPNPFTPGYGAPEQWVPKRLGQTGPWTDVWGLALTIVECVIGRPPIEGDTAAMMGTVLDANRRPTPKSEGAAVSDQIEAVFTKALAVDPRERYQDIVSFWTALERAQDMQPTIAAVAGSPASRGPDEFFGEFSDLDVETHEQGKRPSLPSRANVEAHDSGTFRAVAAAADPPGGATMGASPPPEVKSATDPTPAPSDVPPGFDLAQSMPPARAKEDSSSRSGTFASSTRSGAFPAHRPGGPLPRTAPATEATPRSLTDRVKGPALVVGIAVLLVIVDMILARELGGTLSLGPLKLRWLAGLLFAVSLPWALYNLVSEKEDG